MPAYQPRSVIKNVVIIRARVYPLGNRDRCPQELGNAPVNRRMHLLFVEQIRLKRCGSDGFLLP